MSGGGGFGLGSIGSSLGKVASSALKPVNLAGSAVGSLGGVGTILGPALQLAGGASPLGVFGSSLAGEVLKGYTEKGGSSERPAFVDASGNPIYAQRGYNYGANTYQVSNNPFDASKYFISGNKGVYNLLPMMSSLYDDQGLAARPGSTSYNLYQNIYDKMADDAAAQKAFSERFSVREFNPFDVMSDTQRQIYSSGYTPHPMFNPNRGFSTPGEAAANRNKPQYDIYGGSIFDTRFNKADQVPSYLRDDFNRTFAEYNPLKNFESSGRRFRAPTISPIKYVDFGFGPEETFKDKPLKLIADYASQNKNPFFLAYAPEEAAPAPAPTMAPAPVSVPELAPFTAPVSTLAPTPTTAPAPAMTVAPTAPAPVSVPALAPFTAPVSTLAPTTPTTAPAPAPIPTPFTAPTSTLAPFTAPVSTVASPAPRMPILSGAASWTPAEWANRENVPISSRPRFQSLAERANQISEEAAAERARRGRR